jgi:hypothetical protein
MLQKGHDRYNMMDEDYNMTDDIEKSVETAVM